MQPDSTRVEGYFQRTAVDFDSLYEKKNLVHHWMNRLLRRAIYERVRLTVDELAGMKNFAVLDVGCGSGRNSVIFAQAGARRVLGIDFAPNMIELARSYSATAPSGEHCEFVTGDFFEHRFGQRFEMVVALGVFDYMRQPASLLRRMMELSAGKVMGSFPGISPVRAPLRKLRYSLRNCPVYFYTRARIAEVCRQAGLIDYRIVPCTSAGYMLIGTVGSPASAQAMTP